MNTLYIKERIFSCYKLIYDYLGTIEFDIQNEEKYQTLLEDLKVQCFAIPEEISLLIKEFAEEHIGSYVYDGISSTDFTDGEAEELEDGTINLKSEGALNKLILDYVQGLEKLKTEFAAFAENKLKSYLLEGVA